MATSFRVDTQRLFSSTDRPVVDVYLAVGSNVGDRSAALRSAINELKTIGRLQCTSFLYETAPMYHTDQRSFLNAVCLVQTSLPPLELLDELQSIEQRVGRQASFRNGPRMIDLDILMYGNQSISTDRLQVPHPRIAERAFVLLPLSDIAPGTLALSAAASPIYLLRDALHALPAESKAEIKRVLPVHNHLTKQTKLLPLNSPHLRIMGILNVTPDRYKYCIFDSIRFSLSFKLFSACFE